MVKKKIRYGKENIIVIDKVSFNKIRKAYFRTKSFCKLFYFKNITKYFSLKD